MITKIVIAAMIGLSAWIGKTTFDNSKDIASNTSNIVAAQHDMTMINSQLVTIDSKIDYLIGFKNGK